MRGNDQQNLKELFYNFYCDILNLYKKKAPKSAIAQIGSFSSSGNAYAVSVNAKIRLLSASYYFDNKKKIQKLQSFKNIVKYIKSNKEILNSDGVITAPADKKIIGKKQYEVWGIDYCFGPSIYLIAKEIFENYNRTSLQVKWDFEPLNLDKIKFDKGVLLFRLKNKHSFLPSEKYFYYIQNLNIDKTFTVKIGSKSIQFKRLTDKEKTLFMNSSHVGTENLPMDVGSIETAIISKDLFSENEVKNILTLLRLFKAGEFRLYAIGELKKKLNLEQSITINTSANIVEKALGSKSPFFYKKYKLTTSEIVELKNLFKKSYFEIRKFEFANECLSLLHSTDDKYKIPIIFYILESFFPKIKSENTYRLSYCITKILDKPYSFSETIRNFYTLRSKIVHGDDQAKLKNTIKKIINWEGGVCRNIKECADLLESIMQEVWKQILTKQLYDKDIERELF